MGRRSRTREREAASAAAEAEPAVPAADHGGRRWLRRLNPFRLQGLDQARARKGAIGFGLAAVVFAVAGWVTGDVAWFSSAVLLGVLTVVWGATALLLGRLDRPR